MMHAWTRHIRMACVTKQGMSCVLHHIIRWQGKSFIDLPKDRQNKLQRYSIMCFIVLEGTDRDVVFNIYQVRLATHSFKRRAVQGFGIKAYTSLCQGFRQSMQCSAADRSLC
jgi:hypothetical protein